MFHHHAARAAAPIAAKAKAVAVAKSRPAEHLGFVAYAGAEVVGASHAVVVAVAFYLLVSGVLVLFAFDYAELFGREL